MLSNLDTKIDLCLTIPPQKSTECQGLNPENISQKGLNCTSHYSSYSNTTTQVEKAAIHTIKGHSIPS